MNCRVCNSSEVSVRSHRYLKNLWQCRNCRSEFVWPQPTPNELKRLYEQEYFFSSESARAGYDDYLEDKSIILKTFNKRLQIIEMRYPQKGKLLDLGCATGFFLEAAASRGWQVYGLDISQSATALVGKSFRPRVLNTVLEKTNFPDNYFDLITGWDFLEHVPDPQLVLGICRRILKPEGLLVLTTPDLSSLVARLAGDQWMGYKIDHLFYFSRRGLGTMLENCGFHHIRFGFAGKFIMAKWFFKRLGVYNQPVSYIASQLFNRLALPDFSFYLNPLDIMLVIAKVLK